MTKREVFDLAVSCGLDKKKFMNLLQEKTGVSEGLLEEELDNVSGGVWHEGKPRQTRHCPT